jgi:hypothetical protein
MDTNDKGVRKFIVSLTAMGLLTIGFLAVHFMPALQTVYTEYAMSLLGAASIFSGSNVLEKWRKPA